MNGPQESQLFHGSKEAQLSSSPVVSLSGKI